MFQEPRIEDLTLYLYFCVVKSILYLSQFPSYGIIVKLHG